ncbi:response regulator transcription factor [Blastopirellula sp. JC732]|uniref:Response regulator transcription factor n=1 Tax=Blastopirellula sediminis TaxID=2894196 RepID=A0A9X1SFR4_9BACT|nr:response regulator transcription factor [Blastopirellula sediminis]MCC9609432.1 response regulator transcription factor [Blastopirellula sediminis]MCC9627791.1 response regulator transcription factor [Blastopirellula sediminis]
MLIVEDDPDLLRGLSQALREENYAVDITSDGDDGLFKARSYDYDAIVLDVMLPGMSGFDLLRQLRTAKKTPVLLLTARDALQDRIQGLDEGADDYLVKPFELEELFARLRAIIRRSSGQASSVLTAGDVAVDTAAQTVTFQGELVTLSAREYRLVELLLRNQGALVSRTMIYEHLFDENHDSLSNLVDVYISRLRAKLGSDFITTRRGQGYIVDVAAAH